MLPPPIEAPAPDTIFGDHPLVLEVSIQKTDSWELANYRCGRTLQETVLLLAAVSGAWFDFTPLRRPERHWVAVPSDDRPGPSRYIASPDYGVDGFQFMADRFTEPSALPPIDLLPALEWSRLRLSSDHDELALVDIVTELFDRFDALDSDDRIRFLRSAYWLHYARKVFGLSKSASLVALVQSVEVLISPAPDLKCDVCGGVREYGPTRAFRNFVGKYVPNIDDKARNLLYTARSQITHGSLVLSDDLGGYIFQARHPSEAALDDTGDDAWKAARLGIIGWLRDDNREQV